jgi:hypothetical protein
MNSNIKSLLLWAFALVFTVFIASYQRMTGPTYPQKAKVYIGQQEYKFHLLRTYDGDDDAKIRLYIPDTSVKAEFSFRRFKSYDDWKIVAMVRHGDTLIGLLPHQPPAGKMMYTIDLIKDGRKYPVNDTQPTILRYKGHVPLGILIPHIITIFLAMLFSTRAGLEVLFKGKATLQYTWFTIIFLFIGGLIMGPIVQKFSFGVYWAGWPFGHDLTDNKSIVALIFWVVALIVQYRNREKKTWALIASVIMLVVFLIPHSALGSEIDYTKTQKVENNKYPH